MMKMLLWQQKGTISHTFRSSHHKHISIVSELNHEKARCCAKKRLAIRWMWNYMWKIVVFIAFNVMWDSRDDDFFFLAEFVENCFSLFLLPHHRHELALLHEEEIYLVEKSFRTYKNRLCEEATPRALAIFHLIRDETTTGNCFPSLMDFPISFYERANFPLSSRWKKLNFLPTIHVIEWA